MGQRNSLHNSKFQYTPPSNPIYPAHYELNESRKSIKKRKYQFIQPSIQLTIKSNYSRKVMEGEQLERPFVVSLTKDNRAWTNQLIIAYIIGVDGEQFEVGYWLNGLIRIDQKKYLLYPFPGIYGDSALNPFSADEPVQSLINTDEKGETTFQQLSFSVSGNAGKYKIRFLCQGFFVDTEWIDVLSSIDKVQFTQSNLKLNFTSVREFEQKFTPLLQVSSQTKPIKAKSPSIYLILNICQKVIRIFGSGDGNVTLTGLVIGLRPQEDKNYYLSDDDGLFLIKLKVDYYDEGLLEQGVYLEVMIDQIASNRIGPIIISSTNRRNYFCGFIKPENSQETIHYDRAFSLSFQVFSEINEPLPKSPVSIYFTYEKTIEYQMDQLFQMYLLPTLHQNGKDVKVFENYTDDNGFVQFNNLTIIGYGSGRLFIQVLAESNQFSMDNEKEIFDSENLAQEQEYFDISSIQLDQNQMKKSIMHTTASLTNKLNRISFDSEKSCSYQSHPYNLGYPLNFESDIDQIIWTTDSQNQNKLSNLKKDHVIEITIKLFKFGIQYINNELEIGIEFVSFPGFLYYKYLKENTNLEGEFINQFFAFDQSINQFGDVQLTMQYINPILVDQGEFKLLFSYQGIKSQIPLIIRMAKQVYRIDLLYSPKSNCLDIPTQQYQFSEQVQISSNQCFQNCSCCKTKILDIGIQDCQKQKECNQGLSEFQCDEISDQFFSNMCYFKLNQSIFNGYLQCQINNCQQASEMTNCAITYCSKEIKELQNFTKCQSSCLDQNCRDCVVPDCLKQCSKWVRKQNREKITNYNVQCHEYTTEPLSFNPIVKLYGKNGEAISNTYVTADVYGDALIDIDNDHPSIVTVPERISWSNEYGEAKFENLSILDKLDRGCIQFWFLIGSPEDLIYSFQLTNPVCYAFEPFNKIDNPQSHSQTITLNKPFSIPIQISMIGLRPDIAVASFHLNAIDEYQHSTVSVLTNQMLSKNLCIVYYNTTSQGCYLINSVVIQGNKTLYTVEFTDLKWISSGVSKFKLTLANLLIRPDNEFDKKALRKILINFLHDFNLTLLTQQLEHFAVDHLGLGQQLPLMVQTILGKLEGITQNLEELDFLLKQKQIQSVKNELESIPYYFFKSRTSTKEITIQQTPSSMEVLEHPPETFYVGDMMKLRIVLFSISHERIPKIPVKASLVPFSTFMNRMDERGLQVLIENLGRGQLDINVVGQMLRGGCNIKIDSQRELSRTDLNGVAQFTIQVEAGMPGLYSWAFESKNKQFQLDQKFYLKNKIKKIILVNDLRQTLEGRSLKNRVKFEKNPIVEIFYEDGLSKEEVTYKKSIEIKIFKYIDLDLLQQQMNNDMDSLRKNLRSAYDSAKHQQFNQTVWTVMSTMAEAMMNGARFYDTLKSPEINVLCQIQNNENEANSFQDCELKYVEEFNPRNNSTILKFSSMRIPFPKLGKYQIVVIVDGIETAPSDPPITVVKIEKDRGYYLRLSFEIGGVFIAILSFFFINVPSFAQKMTSSIHNLRVAITNSSTESTHHHHSKIISTSELIKQNKASFICMAIPLLIIFGYIAVLPFYLQWDYISDLWNLSFKVVGISFMLGCMAVIVTNMKNKQDFIIQREEMNLEYTYQKLFSQPSMIWAFKNGERWQSIEVNESNDFDVENIQDLIQIKKFQRNSVKVKARKNLSQNYHMSKLNKLKVRILYEQDKLDLTKQWEITKILMPIVRYESTLCLEEYYFYPQRILASVFVSLFAITFAHALLFNMNFKINDKIYRTISIVEDNFHDSLSLALNAIQQQNYKGLLTEDIFNKIFDQSNLVYDFVTVVARAYFIGFTLGIIITDILQLNGLYRALRTFREHVFLMRKGVYKFNRARINASQSTKMVAYHISNCVISFLIQWFFMTFLFTTFSLPYVWSYMWQKKNAILFFIVNFLISFIGKMIAKRSCIQPDAVTRRTWLGVYDFFMVYNRIGAGVVQGVQRLIRLMIYHLIMYSRVDRNAYCQWVEKEYNVDWVNNSFLSMALTYHQYNNPIMNTFVIILLHSSKEGHQRFIRKENYTYVSKKTRLRIQRFVKRFKSKHQQKEQLQETKEQNLEQYVSHSTLKRLLIIRNRLWLAYFLSKQPLVRKQYRQASSNWVSTSYSNKEPKRVQNQFFRKAQGEEYIDFKSDQREWSKEEDARSVFVSSQFDYAVYEEGKQYDEDYYNFGEPKQMYQSLN